MATHIRIVASSLEAARQLVPRGLKPVEFSGGYPELVEYWA